MSWVGEAEEWGSLGRTSDLISHQAGFSWQAAAHHCPVPILSSQAHPMPASTKQGPSISRPWPGLPLSSLPPPNSGALFLTPAPRFLGQRWLVY